MEKLKILFNQYFWLLVIVWLIIIAALVFWLAGAVGEVKFDGAVGNRTTEANQAVKQAANAANAAANVSIERRTEDAVREKTITPRLGESRRRSENSQAELNRARKTYNDKKTHTANLSSSDADCRELHRLFPEIRFEECQ